MTNKDNQEKSLPSKPLKNFAKYGGMGIQMAAIMLLGIFAGIKLDEWLGWKFPVFTIVLALLSVFAALYFVLKDLIKN